MKKPFLSATDLTLNTFINNATSDLEETHAEHQEIMDFAYSDDVIAEEEKPLLSLNQQIISNGTITKVRD